MKFDYGIIAVNLDNPNKDVLEILHYVGYPKQPSELDFEDLEEELKTDEELGMIGKNYLLINAPKNYVEKMNKDYFSKIEEI